MSTHKIQLRLTKRAQQDLRTLLSYTQRKWGERQRTIYKLKIDKALNTIIEKPHKGLKKHGLMMLRMEHHHIFYEIDLPTIYIIRILHERMDSGKHLPH